MQKEKLKSWISDEGLQFAEDLKSIADHACEHEASDHFNQLAVSIRTLLDRRRLRYDT